MLVRAMKCQFKRFCRIFAVAVVAAVLLTTYLVDRPATPTADDATRPRDRSIDAVERHCFRFDVGGRMFDEGGRGEQVSGILLTYLFSYRRKFGFGDYSVLH